MFSSVSGIWFGGLFIKSKFISSSTESKSIRSGVDLNAKEPLEEKEELFSVSVATTDSLFEISMYVHENPELLEEFPEFFDVKSDLENYLGVKIGE